MNQHDAMKGAEQLYYSLTMKCVLARLTGEWQTATQLGAKWGTLQTLVVRGHAERRDNPESVAGVDYYQWRKVESGK